MRQAFPAWLNAIFSPSGEAQRWKLFAIGGAAIAGIFVLCAGVAVSHAQSPEKTAQAFSPFFVTAIAFVTFLTVMWRGAITNEQLREQRRQNDAKDEENLAKLLIDGVKLLGENQQSHILAGIAALKAVVIAPNDRFSSQAMDILLDLVLDVYAEPDRANTFRACRWALDEGNEMGRRGTRILTLKAPDDAFEWEVVNGARIVTYEGGCFVSSAFKRLTLQTFHRFKKCAFYECEIEDAFRFSWGCKFFECKIMEMSIALFQNGHFDGCNFSNARWNENSRGPIKESVRDFIVRGVSSRNNYFYVDQEPDPLGDFSLASSLVQRAEEPAD